MPVDISMIGDRSLERMLKRLPDAMQKKVMRKAMREAAKPILKAARANVRSMTGPLSGKLRTGLQLRALPRSRRAIGVRVQTKPREHFGIPPESRWYYPAHVEYGHHNVKPRPYLRNAFDENEGKGLRIIQREARAGITREAMKK